MADNMMKGTIPVYCLSNADKAALARIYKGTVPNDAETTGKQQVAEDHEEDGITLLKGIAEQLTIVERLPEIFSKVEAIVKENNLQIPERPEQWIFDALDHEDKVRVMKEWISKATKQEEEQAPTPDEAQTQTPSEENQDSTGGVEMDLAEEAANMLRVGQIVGILLMCAKSDDEPTEEKTAAPAEKEALEPTSEVITFAAASREDIKKLNDLVGDLTDPNNEPEQTRGRVRDICDLALKLGADRLVNVCEAFTEGDVTRAEVTAKASEVLTYLAAETRRAELNEAFEQFCVNQRITPEEMLAILS